MSNRVVHFEIHADEPERAAKFYTDVFGWEIKRWEGLQWDYWVVMTAPKDSKDPGINGGMMKRMSPAPVNGAAVNAYACTVQVDSYDETYDKILKAGGTVALPKFPLVGIAWQGYFLDTEGNIFGVHQPDISAK